MSDPAADRRPPTGLQAWFARAPRYLFRWRLGRLLGNRFCLLVHTGRTSGLPREVVLEVCEHDPATGSVTVASGFGRRSQWFRNILADPAVTIQVGGRPRTPATAQVLPPQESGEAMARYAAAHPRSARAIVRMLKLDPDGGAGDYEQIARQHIPFVRFTPAGSASDPG